MIGDDTPIVELLLVFAVKLSLLNQNEVPVTGIDRDVKGEDSPGLCPNHRADLLPEKLLYFFGLFEGLKDEGVVAPVLFQNFLHFLADRLVVFVFVDVEERTHRLLQLDLVLLFFLLLFFVVFEESHHLGLINKLTEV